MLRKVGKLIFNKETSGYRHLREILPTVADEEIPETPKVKKPREKNDMVREKMVKVPKRLVDLVHSMATKIQYSHDGWWESHCSCDEKALVKFSTELKRPSSRKIKT